MSEELQVSLPAPDEQTIDFRTSCEHCVFASWDGAEQTGCRLGRLAKLEKAGAVIEQVNLEGGRSCKVVKGRVCVANRHRESDWVRKYRPSEWDSVIQSELRIPFRAVILVGATTTRNEIDLTVSSFGWQTVKPAHVSLAVSFGSPLTVPRASRLLQREDFPWTWNVSKREEPGTWGEDLDESILHCKQGWYAVFRAGFIVPPSFFSEIQTALVDRCERFVLLTSHDGVNGLVAQTKLHTALRGFGTPAELVVPETGSVQQVTGLVEKAISLAKASGYDHMIRDVREVCPCLA